MVTCFDNEKIPALCTYVMGICFDNDDVIMIMYLHNDGSGLIMNTIVIVGTYAIH